MKTLKALFVLALLGAGAGAAFLYSGTYNMAADDPHWPMTFKLLETLRERSIAMRIRDIDVPVDLGDAARVPRGAGNYDAMCVGCHLKPGMDDSEIRKGLYPQPPNLAQAAHDRGDGDPNRSAVRQFWIIKHGIKASGMPAWSKGGVDDATIWDMVALLQKLPQLSPEDYEAAVAASEGHTHAGGTNAQKKHENGHEHTH